RCRTAGALAAVLTVTLVVATQAQESAVAKDSGPMRDAPLDAGYLRRHSQTRGFMLGRPVRPQPTPDGAVVLFLRAQARVPRLRLYEFDVATGNTRLP